MEHRRICDNEPSLLGDNAVVKNSHIYNGCKIGGTVINSILFPGVHVKEGAVVENSVLFFKNIVGKDCRINKVVSDVNNNFGTGVRVGPDAADAASEVTVLGWNNQIPKETRIEEGATVYPQIESERWLARIKAGEVLK